MHRRGPGIRPTGGRRRRHGPVPYIQTRGTVSFDADSVLRVLNAEKCAANGGGTYTLLSNSNTDITGVIQHIEASPDVTVTQTARSIVVHIADRSNTLILLR